MKINNEMRIGIFFVSVIIILGILTWRAGDIKIRNGGYEVMVHFKNIDGVALNAPVTVNGLEVGRVSGINILYGQETIMQVKLWMQDHVKLHEGAQAFIKNLGFLGEKYVGLTTGDDTKAFLKPGSIIRGDEPPSFEKLLSQGDKIALNLESISTQLDERLKNNARSIDSIILNLDTTVKDFASISAIIKERLENNGGSIDEIVSNVNMATKNLEEMSFDLKENPWKLLYKGKPRK
ncbi:MAG: MlaD family protein [Candidatus Omnitrophota bacterium]